MSKSTHRFHYQAYAANGDLSAGVIEAGSVEAAADALDQRGLTLFAAKELTGQADIPWWKRDLFANPKLPSGDLTGLMRELSTLADANLPLDETLQLIHEQCSPGKRRALLGRVRDQVIGGATLSDSFASDPIKVPAHIISMIKAGEKSGSLKLVLGEVASHLERVEHVRARLKSALLYPAILMVAALASVALVINVLIPNIEPLFEESAQAMPASLLFVLETRNMLLSHWQVIVAATGSLAALILMLWRRDAFRYQLDRRLLQVPLLKDVLAERDAARLCRTLGTLLQSGVTLPSGLQITGDVLHNRQIKAYVRRVTEDVQEGTGFATSLTAGGIMPAPALRLVHVGERTGKLSNMLLHAAHLLESRQHVRVERIMTMLTPVLTIMIGLAVGGLIMTVMNAILSVNELALQ